MKTTDEVVGRPRCRRAKQRDEHASFHSITSSARASSVGPLGVDSWGDDAKVYLGQLTFREDASDDRLSPTLLAKTSSGSCPASRRRSRKFCVAATFRERTAASSLFKSAGLRSFPLGVALRERPGIFLRRLLHVLEGRSASTPITGEADRPPCPDCLGQGKLGDPAPEGVLTETGVCARTRTICPPEPCLDAQLAEQARSRDHESSDECGQAKNQHDVTQEDGANAYSRLPLRLLRAGPSYHLKAVPWWGPRHKK